MKKMPKQRRRLSGVTLSAAIAALLRSEYSGGYLELQITTENGRSISICLEFSTAQVIKSAGKTGKRGIVRTVGNAHTANIAIYVLPAAVHGYFYCYRFDSYAGGIPPCEIF